MDDSEKEKKEILIKDKNENNIKEKSELQNEPKSYMNCHCCQISIGLILTYTYIFISIFLNLNNRIIYHKYNFRFNFTLLFIQQLFSLITFFILSFKSKTFKDKTGEISFKDFLKFKYYYLSFCIIFLCNMLSSFYGNQLVINVSMYVTLRKLVLVMIFFLDFFVFKKSIKLLTIFSVFLISIGTTLVSMDDFTSDYLGYIVVIINNSLTIIYVKFGENFKKKTGVTNLKLLVYNSYLSQPILIAAIFIRGEYKKVFLYFNNENIIDKNYYYGFLFYLFISCSLCIILNSSFLLSNEKNSSLFTQLLSNSKDILFAFLSYFILKNNKLTIRIIIGLIISTAGALLISMKSLSENLKFEKKEEEEEDKELEDKEQV
jgi:drug/metabolite transporter (DMT)-like permease